jgi:hypothetical protein
MALETCSGEQRPAGLPVEDPVGRTPSPPDRCRGLRRLAKGRAARTHCPKGHPLSGDNLAIVFNAAGRAWRRCRACARANNSRCGKRKTEARRARKLESPAAYRARIFAKLEAAA